MSYAIVKSIKIQEGKVFLHSTANNVSPYDWRTWECTYFSEILKNQGQEGLDKAILLSYWEGNLQKSNNNYQKSVDTFDRTIYNWDFTSVYSDEFKSITRESAQSICKERTEEVKQKLYEHYINFKNRKKEKWFIKYQNQYLCKITSRSFKFSPNRNNAKIFDSQPLALNAISCAANKESYTFHQVV